MTTPFNVGHDAQVTVVDGPTGAVITTFPPTTMFDFKPTTKRLMSEPVNGKPIYREVPQGWEGTLEYDRYDGAIDDYFATWEANYWNGASYLAGSITQTVQEQTGAISQYQYQGVAMKLDTAGTYKAADKVPVKITWCASTRVKVL